MIVGATLALLATLLPSFAVYRLLLRLWSRAEAPLGGALAAAVAPGLGIGFASCLYFVLLHLTPNRDTAVTLDAGLWITSTAWLLIGARRRTQSLQPDTNAADKATNATLWMWTPAMVVSAVGFLMLFAFAAWSFWLHSVINPDGEWDAFAIWNLRARAIARGAPDWAAVFSPDLRWSSPHYPLLVPLSVARLWAYAGGESTVVPAVVALLFFVSSVAVVVIGVGRLRGWSIGLLSGMALVMSRTYVFQSACQCGDVPLGFYILVAICFIAMSLQAAEPGPLFLTAGAAAGLAVWTKNEGIPLLALVVLAASLRAPRLRALAHVIAGAAVPALVLIFFKLQLESSNYLFEQQGSAAAVQKLIDVSRWIRVTDRLAVLVPAWGAVPGGALVCLGLAVAITMRVDRRSVARAAFALLLVIAMCASYILVYVISPLPLEWQMNVSFDRLLVQLWPALVWAAFQLSGSPLLPRPGEGRSYS